MTAETKNGITSRDIIGFVIFFIALAFGFGGFVGDLLATSRIRSEAINAGVARWTVNPETGKTKFEWITNAETSK